MFRVSTLDLMNLPRTDDGKIDFVQDFFGREAFLTVSGQLNIEAYYLALTKVYTFGPTFRVRGGDDRPIDPEEPVLVEKAMDCPRQHGSRALWVRRAPSRL